MTSISSGKLDQADCRREKFDRVLTQSLLFQRVEPSSETK